MADNIKISALNELVSGSIAGASVVPIVEAGVTYRTQLSAIKAFTNSDVATDIELANNIATVNNTINALSTNDITEGTSQYYTDTRVKTKLNAEGILSGSLPAGYNLDVTDGTTTVTSVDSISITGGSVTNNGNGDVVLAIPNFDLTISDARNESVANVSQIKLVGATVEDSGSGIIQLTVDVAESIPLNTFTGSIDSRVQLLEGDVALLIDFTGSFSSSIQGRVTTLESAGGGGEETPQGTVSGSQQITDFGFTSSSLEILQSGASRESDAKSINFIGAGVSTSDGAVTVEFAGGGDGDGGGVSYDTNFHIISQSSTLPGESNIILTDIKLGTGLNDFKFIDFSESLDTRVGTSNAYVSSVSFAENALTFTGIGDGFNGNVSLSSGIISSSTQLDTLGYLKDSDITIDFVEERLPRNLVSGSTQLTELGVPLNENTSSFALNDNITGSFTELSASIAATNVSTQQLGEVTRSLLEGGSFNDNGEAINLVSSSLQIQEVISDTYISASVVASGFGASNQSLNTFTGSIDGRVILLEASEASLNTFTGSFSSSIESRVTTIEASGGGGAQLEIKDNYSVISQSYDFGESNLKLEAIEIGGESGNFTFKQVSQSLENRINAFAGATELGGLSDVGTITVDVLEGDILVYDSVAQEFTHSQDLTGNYKITGSINVTGSITADSFIAGDVGTPTINAATLLEIKAGTSVEITAGDDGLILSSSADVRVNDMLTLEKTIGNPTTLPSTGSMMNSGSIDSDSKLWFYNGTAWKEVQFVS
jgi:hypothetical protein|tara:strand:+ start:899 stop:3217 length:2319 start_codon:yes stop_codon:yes gene_type:complete